jgi:TonB family protein
MQSLFNGRHFDSESPPATSVARPAGQWPEPRLLLEITPWRRVFFRNLLDALLFFRRESPLDVTSRPGAFWPDVFVNRRLPLRPFWQSALYHVFVVVVLYGLSNSVLFRPQRLSARNPFEHSTITYYSVSEYLPPINTAAETERAKLAKKGEPAHAIQKIVSIRPNAESHAQTIISPQDIRLPQDVKIPNIVAWNPVLVPVPTAMAVHSGQQIVAPTPSVVAPAPSVTPHSTLPLPVQDSMVVPPAPVVDSAKLRAPLDILARSVVPPAPVIDKARVNSPNLPLPSVVEPPVSPQRLPSRAGELNIGNVSVVPPAPKLPVPEQHARGSLLAGQANATGKPGRARGAFAAANTSVVPPPPSVPSGQSGGSRSAGQLIALSINPVAASGPIDIPRGNRPGTFAAGPEGKPDAPGTPDIKGGGETNGPGGSGEKIGNAGPSGIYVESGPSTTFGSVVVAGPQKPTASGPARTTTLASLSHPSLTELARGTRTTTAPAPPAPSLGIENKVFGAKRFYSMTLNMPNLTSRGGSWILHFAELNVSAQSGEVSAPVAVRKVDPAYPSDLLRDRVEGTVVLYAIIRANGAVEDVRVLRGVDERLDEYARKALQKWQFRPGTKNGTAVDLETVVQIPFVSRPPFSQ